MLNAFYDLALSPAKYDFVGFLLDAERMRQLTGEDYIRFIFVPGPNNGFRVDNLPPHNTDVRHMMLNNIIFPMCFMTGTPNKFIVCKKRRDAEQYQVGEIFPSEYRAGDPSNHYGTHIMCRNFARGFYPLRAFKPIEKQSGLVTITLRESHYWPFRNSNRETWLEAAKMIKSAGLKVLFIPDTDSKPVEGWESDELASLDLHRRSALYEAAEHNFFVSNGPAWMAAAMSKPNCTMFKLLAEKSSCTTKEYFEEVGFPIGSQIGRDNHRILWEDDTKEAVLPVVEEVIKGIL